MTTKDVQAVLNAARRWLEAAADEEAVDDLPLAEAEDDLHQCMTEALRD